MNKKNDSLFITEISEEDFRKLDLTGEVMIKSGKWETRKLNDVLDEEIKYLYEQGYASDLESLICPVTIAIHNPGDYYLDKFMNAITGATTYQIGFGIKHLYSNRDYFLDREDYWLVRKKETKSIYRIHLDKKWAENFVLLHKEEVVQVINDNTEIVAYYDFDVETKEWKETRRVKVVKHKHSTLYLPLDEKEGIKS